jgi:hypothetical protein
MDVSILDRAGAGRRRLAHSIVRLGAGNRFITAVAASGKLLRYCFAGEAELVDCVWSND